MIDLRLLGQAIDYYKDLGYEYVEVPWLVKESTSLLTLPEGKNSNCIKDDGRCFIGSAEQGIIELFLNNKVEKNKKYVSFSPCLRIGDDDEYHKEFFYKVELSYFCDSSFDAPKEVIPITQDARELFSNLLKVPVNEIRAITTSDTNVDLVINEVEIGSYGYRKIDENSYIIYGTGLALPRLNMVFQNNCYHTKPIIKGKLETISKIEEEVMELKDAFEQKDQILQLCELSDLIGAIEEYAQTLGISIEDIIKFKNKTKKAFEKGIR